MKRPLPVALVVEGNATNSALFRLPGLTDEIGPIKSTAMRVARRFSNSFRAGQAVSTYEDLQESRLLLIRVPDESLMRVVGELCASDLNLKRMSIAVCETWIASEMLSQLREAGASVATVTVVSGSGGQWFVGEGDTPAVRQVKRLIEFSGGRLLGLKPGAKALYFAAEVLATALPLRLLFGSQLCLRQAGVSGRLLSGALDQLAHKLLRNFKAGVRPARGGLMQMCSSEVGQQHIDTVRLQAPTVADLIDAELRESRVRRLKTTAGAVE